MSTANDPANVGDEQQRTTPRRVLLLVEEEPEILIILHRSLRDLTVGYDLVMTKTGSEALALFAVRDIRMVITAYNLPAMNGISLTTEIKNVAPTTPVVLITAYATPELEKRARAAGVDYFLPKPYLLDRLRQIVREVIRFD